MHYSTHDCVFKISNIVYHNFMNSLLLVAYCKTTYLGKAKDESNKIFQMCCVWLIHCRSHCKGLDQALLQGVQVGYISSIYLCRCMYLGSNVLWTKTIFSFLFFVWPITKEIFKKQELDWFIEKGTNINTIFCLFFQRLRIGIYSLKIRNGEAKQQIKTRISSRLERKLRVYRK